MKNRPNTRGARTQLAWRMADVLEYRVDMSRELTSGTVLSVLFLRSIAPDGTTRIGSVLAARLELPGRPIEAIRFEARAGSGRYFDQNGRALRTAFLRAPLAFRRISSVFGLREHPVLGGWREHRGTDYAAAWGTPVHSVADGRVTFAGTRRGYGNVIDVRHDNGVVSRYGHLRGFAAAIDLHARVRIGQTIGYVGMTGLATGPHLHFEMLVDGVARDPRAALAAADGGERLALADRPAFDSTRAALLSALDGRAGR